RELAELLGLNPDAPQGAEKPKPLSEAVARSEPEVRAPTGSRSEPEPPGPEEPSHHFEREPRSVSPAEMPEQMESAPERENISPPAEERGAWRPPARDEDRPHRGKRRQGRRDGSERDSEFSSGGAPGDRDARDRQSAD